MLLDGSRSRHRESKRKLSHPNSVTSETSKSHCEMRQVFTPYQDMEHDYVWFFFQRWVDRSCFIGWMSSLTSRCDTFQISLLVEKSPSRCIAPVGIYGCVCLCICVGSVFALSRPHPFRDRGSRKTNWTRAEGNPWLCSHLVVFFFSVFSSFIDI